jgi:hypothetical protein
MLSKSRQSATQADESTLLLMANLACAALDTLLCVLVDCPELIRTFERVGGVEAIVRLLKRNGTARSVR